MRAFIFRGPLDLGENMLKSYFFKLTLRKHGMYYPILIYSKDLKSLQKKGEQLWQNTKDSMLIIKIKVALEVTVLGLNGKVMEKD